MVNRTTGRETKVTESPQTASRPPRQPDANGVAGEHRHGRRDDLRVDSGGAIRLDDAARRPSRFAPAALLFFAAQLAGCAAFHPLHGVPASYVPHEYRGETRSGKKTINLNLLVRRPQAQYRIDSGDVLAVYIPGVLGRLNVNLEEAGEEPPIINPHNPGDPPTMGFPVTVRGDGTIPLPYVRPIHVAGRTLPEVEEAVRRAYSEQTKIMASDEDLPKRIVVALQRPREYRILVVRQETSDAQSQIGNINIGSSKKGTARIVHLRAYENDVLHALARAEGADGLPGLDAENAIYIIRRRGASFSAPAPTPHPIGPQPNWPTPAPTPASMSGHSVLGASATVPAAGPSTFPGRSGCTGRSPIMQTGTRPMAAAS